MSFVPSHDVLGEGERLAFVCHGILGSRQNWRGFARRLAAALPGWRVVTPDHRNHGVKNLKISSRLKSWRLW